MAFRPAASRCPGDDALQHSAPRKRQSQSQSQSQPQQPPVMRKSSLALVAAAFVATSFPSTAMAQQCISLSGSTTCPAFSNASISTNTSASDLAIFPFLPFVSDVESFDSQFRQYISTTYAREKYQTLLGCSSVNLTNTTDIYARYTTSVLCNAIVQKSISACGVSTENSRPLCADSCADYAISEQEISASPGLCGTPGANAMAQIRSDFTTCSEPARALSGSCIEASANEPDECGYQSNLPGLCSYCAQSSPNATDSCCVNANVEKRCEGVKLPTPTSMPPLFPSSTSTASPTGGPQKSGAGLSGGAIAGIVVGSLVGAALILGAIVFCCMQMRKRKQSQHGSVLNTPTPTRQATPGPSTVYQDSSAAAAVLPGARVARMSALSGRSSLDRHSDRQSSRVRAPVGAYTASHDGAYSTPESGRGRSPLGANLPKRGGSLSSHSALAMTEGHSSPHSNSNSNADRSLSSPEGVASGQSEQLQFFKDYYSQDDIHPNDTVATLWAYQPRANDEFELERGDLLKVVGIWDDGWATGVKLSGSAEEWDSRKALHRDSGVSNGSRKSRDEVENEIKAFPLVCVCLPQHWRKTIEGDTTDTGPSTGGERQPPSP